MLLHHFKMNKFIFFVCVCPWIFTVHAINCQAQSQNKVSSADDILINCSLILDEPFLVHNILPNRIYKLQVLNISENIRYVIFQAHSQANKLLMSYQLHVKNYLQITNETYVEGKDIGLVVLLEPGHTSAEVYLQSLSPTDFLLIAQGYGSSDPVPGGCNMEFDVEISPYLLMNYDISKTQVKYQRASIINSRNSSQQSCDDSINFLSYEVYVYFMEENNCSQNLYFDSLKKMYNFNSIQQNALKIIPPRIQTPLLVEIPTFRRVGTVFNIVVSHNQTHSVAYIPVVSYGCNLSPVSDSNSCTNILSVIEWILACFGAGIGIFLCFVGHRFFKTSMVCFGFSSVAVISYILLARFGNLSYNNVGILIFTIALGAVGGVGWIVFWYWMGSPLLSLTLVGCNLGFLIASIIFFTPLGKIDVFSCDLNYWLLFSCIILLIHVICINFAQKYHIISCAIIGSFGLIVLLDRYSAGTLTYIILNVLRRATDPSFNTVILVVPFQITDIILSCTWALLAGLGIIVQLVREKRKPPFPVSPRHVQRLSRISSSSPSSALPANETDVWHCSFPSTTDIASLEQEPLLGRSNVPENRVKIRDYSSIKDEERPLPYT